MVRVSMASAFEKCPLCAKSLRAENLPGHLQDVHPREAGESLVREARRKAPQTPKRAASPPLRARWKPILAVVIVAAVLVAVFFGLSAILNRPFDPFQCVETVGGPRAHFHVYLNISIGTVGIEVPGDIGVRSGCTGIIHTHASEPLEDGYRKIHYEGPVGHRYTIGEFFTVWGVPFSRERVGGFIATPDGPGPKIFFLVGDVVNPFYEEYRPSTQSCDSLASCEKINIVGNP